MNKNIKATVFAILAAALYAINTPISKSIIANVGPAMMAAFSYLGAGIGIFIYRKILNLSGRKETAEPLSKKDMPYTVGMVLLDIIAPILLMLGIERTSSANVSLLNNFEIVATTLIAFFIFKEAISKRTSAAIVLVTIASIICGFEGKGSFDFNLGSLFVLAAAASWGLENNCTKELSQKSSFQIVTVKGIFSGLGSLIVALLAGESLPEFKYIAGVLLLGFVAYGLSINFYIMAQKDLGAAKTGAYYAVAPFLGVLFSMVMLGEKPAAQFYLALIITIISTSILIKDSLAFEKE